MLRCRPKPIRWYEPRWSFVPRTMHELRATGLLSIAPWVRILGISGAIGGAAVLALYLAAPAVVPPLHTLVLPFVLGPAMLTIPLAMGFLIPPRITVRHDRIVIEQGQHPLRLDRSKVTSLRLDAADPLRPTLHVGYVGARAERARSIGVSPKVDLVALAAFLGEDLRVDGLGTLDGRGEPTGRNRSIGRSRDVSAPVTPH